MASTREKLLGQFFTPEPVAAFLTEWAVRDGRTAVLDPSCGDGRFLGRLEGGVGVEMCARSAAVARERAPRAEVVVADFFEWAEGRGPSFDAAIGNPPFIRYQQFSGATRKRALKLSQRLGVNFSKLASSWAPFIAVAASLLKPGGRLAFVVPAEIGHATYAEPLLEGLCRHFAHVNVIAIREKLFPELSQDAWLLFADGKGGRTDSIGFTAVTEFTPDLRTESPERIVPVSTWRELGRRLRKLLLPTEVLGRYLDLSKRVGCTTLGQIADVTIGYVSGANDFFHFSAQAARLFEIPEEVLRPTVRRGEQLTGDYVDEKAIKRWIAADEEVLVLDLSRVEPLPPSVRSYLDSPAGQEVRTRYKCRVRNPWYVIPGVEGAPSAFVTCMSGRESRLAINRAGAVCSNSLLAVTLRERVAQGELLRAWRHPLSRLSQELEGHPLGGGMLKLEPGEARRVVLPLAPFRMSPADERLLGNAINLMREWRHYEAEADRP